MERAISVFVWLAAGLGFAYGLLFTESRILPALGGAVIFGTAAMMLVGLGAVLSELVSRLARPDGRDAGAQPRPGESDG